jgi:ubiquinone/menaquinone biosynthesis C-methylase UbiE
LGVVCGILLTGDDWVISPSSCLADILGAQRLRLAMVDGSHIFETGFTGRPTEAPLRMKPPTGGDTDMAGARTERPEAAAASFFDSVAEDYRRAYSGDRSVRMVPTAQLLRKRLIAELLPSRLGRVLEVGGGPAAYADFLLSRAEHVTCVDVSSAMLAAAREEHATAVADERLSLIQGSVTELPFADGAFDWIIAAGVVEYVQDDVQALGQMRRCLTDDGMACVSFPLRHPVLANAARIRSKVARLARAALSIEPPTRVPFPFHRNYDYLALCERIGRAGLRIRAEYYSHYFLSLPVGFPGGRRLMTADHWVALRSSRAPSLARSVAESAVLLLAR